MSKELKNIFEENRYIIILGVLIIGLIGIALVTSSPREKSDTFTLAGQPLKIYRIDKVALEEGLVQLGVERVKAHQIRLFAHGREIERVTLQEKDAAVLAYNRKLDQIRADCDKDKRCRGDGEIFWEGESGEQFDIKNLVEKWIADDYKNPNAHKK